ncbi:hypothetical protein [Nannocystis bainbridge]|uniref:DUF4440 domain-containing protein n=1 Tax=Nannocystis bainbridge TaxID=2995303 RepID=A0ABT5DXF1_9BACT|nr:hypothetical protein [Nannocystis bainbridge]MDC0718304.1 hypothetical protein [Nannocystis bainbridge]
MSRSQDLSKLLAKTLSVEEMRQLSRELPDGHVLKLNILEGNLTRSSFASDLVEVLVRHKMLDSALFERWVERVPGQREAIEDVARAWDITLPLTVVNHSRVPRGRRGKMLGVGGALVLLVVGIGSSFVQRGSERVCFAGRDGVPELAHAACATYLDTIRAYNERDLARYHAGFAAPMECFYDHTNAEIGQRRSELRGSLDVAPASVSFLRVEGADRVVLCDLGVYDRGDGKGRKPHNKVIVMTQRGGEWKIAVETSREAAKCYQSPC